MLICFGRTALPDTGSERNVLLPISYTSVFVAYACNAVTAENKRGGIVAVPKDDGVTQIAILTFNLSNYRIYWLTIGY